MKRREFIAVLAGAVAGPMSWPIAVRGQPRATPVVGILNGGAPLEYAPYVDISRHALSEAGYVEDHNLALVYHSADGAYDRLPSLAAELVHREVALIFAIGGASALAGKAATAAIPIVFANGGDPVRIGLVTSISRPGANVTGVNWFGASLEAKRLEFLCKLVPGASKIGFLVNLSNPNSDFQARQVEVAASAAGKQVQLLGASTDDEIVTAFATIVQKNWRTPSRNRSVLAQSARPFDRACGSACHPCDLSRA
jgi:putative ABC transport system substrate-binding protein